jgi:ABC-2 type transport system permease protein
MADENRSARVTAPIAAPRSPAPTSTSAHRFGWRHSVQCFRGLIRIQVKAKLEYRADLMVQLLAATLPQVAWLAFASILFSRLPRINSWDLPGVVFLHGLGSISLGLCVLVFDGVWKLPEQIKTGEFDSVVLRPFDPMLHVLAQDISLRGLGNFTLGTAALCWSAPKLDLVYGWWTAAFIPLFALCGAVIYGALTLAAASASFWLVDIGGSLPMFFNQLCEFGRFPFDLYPVVVAGALTWVLPVAFVGFLPSSFLLGQQSGILGILSPLVAFVFCMLSRQFFIAGMKRYESSGT